MSDSIVDATDLDAYTVGDPDLLLDQATAAVREHCGWHITPARTETVTVRLVCGQAYLPSMNVTAISSVVVNGTTVDAATYEWQATGGLWLRSHHWAYKHYPTATVTFTHGYDEAPSVAGVILARTSRARQNPKSASAAGPFSETYTNTVGFTDAEIAVLSTYRLPLVS